jgi:hypothetical protein
MTDDRDNRDDSQQHDVPVVAPRQIPEVGHTLQSVADLLRTPTEGQDLRKSFFLPLEFYDGEDGE